MEHEAIDRHYEKGLFQDAVFKWRESMVDYFQTSDNLSAWAIKREAGRAMLRLKGIR
jgi:hypothetical protein